MGEELSKEKLDEEWIKLIQEAIEVGISVEEIRGFLEENKSPTINS